MLSIQTFSLVVLLAILPICMSYPSIRVREIERQNCRGCGTECDKCTYGVALSTYCGVLECRKGPSEACGGYDNVHGVCGDGMICLCRKCSGCSTDTYKCSSEVSDEVCLPKDEEMSGYWNSIRNTRFTVQ